VATENGYDLPEGTAGLIPADPAHLKFRQNFATVASQSSVYFVGTTFTLLGGYLFRFYVVRHLGAALVGWNALGMSLYGICKLFGQMGLPQTALRYVAAYDGAGEPGHLRAFFKRALFWTFLGTSSLGTLVICARHWLAARIFHAPEFAAYLPLFAVLIPIGATSAFLNQTLCGFRKVSRSMTITNFISFPFMMVLTVVALMSGLSLWGYVFAQVAAESLTLVLAALSLRTLLPAPSSLPEPDGLGLPGDVKQYALAIFGIGVVEFILGQSDRLIVGYYLEAKQLGIYAVAGSLAALIPLGLQSVNSIFAPTIAKLFAEGENALLSRLFQTITKWVLGFALPLVLVFVFFSHQLMGLLGKEFEAGWFLLVLGAIAQTINCGTGSVGYFLLMSGNQKQLIRVQVAVSILVLLGDVTLIPVFGITGAAVVAALGATISNLAYLFVVRRKLNLWPYNRHYLRLAGPVAATALTIWLVSKIPLFRAYANLPAIIVSLILGYAVFLVGSLAFGLDDDDRLLWQVARSRLPGGLGRWFAAR
jgi:O-antigen/teichoic acid export membrane protein